MNDIKTADEFKDIDLKILFDRMRLKILQKKPLKITTNPNKDEKYLNIGNYDGVVEYYPEELVMTVRAGTKISDIEQVLDQHNQALLFKTSHRTIGGAYVHGDKHLRNAVLGVQVIDGRGQLLNFGGRVMKNVAGYDVARLLVGSQGKLAVITQVTFKVLPKTSLDNHPQIQYHTAKKNNDNTQFYTGLKYIFDPKDIFI